MKLVLALRGDAVTCAIAEGTLSHRYAVRHDGARVLALTREVLGSLARAARERSLGATNLADLRRTGEELYRRLLPPEVQDALRERDGALLLELDEGLVAVPWELLHDGAEFLCRRYDLGRTVATAQPPRGGAARRVGTPLRVLVLAADPTADLPQARAEAEAIVAELDGRPGLTAQLLTAGDVASVARQLKEFDAVHFAGHADVSPEAPEEAGWRLADGRLTARAVAELAGGRPLPLLVVANACRSGITEPWSADPARIYGQCNAFLLAGVQYYLGTQWDVVDGRGAAFAVAFWSEVASGSTVGAAVRRARGRVVALAGEEDLGWAPYVLYGDPAFAPLGQRAAAEDRTLVPMARALAGRPSTPFKKVRVAVPRVAARQPRGRRSALALGGLALLVGAVAISGYLARGPRATPDAAGPPRTLALLGIRPGPSIEEGAPAQAAALESCLLVALARRGHYRLVDRARITAFLAHARDGGLALAGDDRQASAAGRALKADYVIYGEATVVARQPFFSVFCADPSTQQVLFGDRLDGLDAAGCDALAARILTRLAEVSR